MLTLSLGPYTMLANLYYKNIEDARIVAPRIGRQGGALYGAQGAVGCAAWRRGEGRGGRGGMGRIGQSDSVSSRGGRCSNRNIIVNQEYHRND